MLCYALCTGFWGQRMQACGRAQKCQNFANSHSPETCIRSNLHVPWRKWIQSTITRTRHCNHSNLTTCLYSQGRDVVKKLEVACEIQHRNDMAALTTEYARTLAKLEWIFLGQRPNARARDSGGRNCAAVGTCAEALWQLQVAACQDDVVVPNTVRQLNLLV
jgi:hypothetical protein